MRTIDHRFALGSPMRPSATAKNHSPSQAVRSWPASPSRSAPLRHVAQRRWRKHRPRVRIPIDLDRYVKHIWRKSAASHRCRSVSVPNQISCRFERRYWVNSFPEGLPGPGFDLGGLSGAPLLRPVYSQTRRTWIVQLAGVTTEAHSTKDWEQVTAATAAHIRPDGRIVHLVL